MALQQTITIIFVETIDELTELLYVVGIYIVVCGKLPGLMLNRDKITIMMDNLNGCSGWFWFEFNQ